MKEKIAALNILFLLFGFVLGAMLGILIGLNLQSDENFSTQANQSTVIPKDADWANGNQGVIKPLHDITSQIGRVPIESKEAFINWALKNTKEKKNYLDSRWELSRAFLESSELDRKSLQGFLRTPREYFVRERNLGKAYDDTWLAIGHGVTITDPDVVAMMTTTLNVQPDDKVLEIGTGSGYQSAILANLSNFVYTIEINKPIFYETDELQKKLASDYPAYKNIKRKLGDGFFGWDEYQPFQKIIVTCAIDHVPPPLIKQLAPNGIMVLPLGPPQRQLIMEIKKVVNPADNRVSIERRDVYNGLGVKFIPFRNEANTSYSDDAAK